MLNWPNEDMEEKMLFYDEIDVEALKRTSWWRGFAASSIVWITLVIFGLGYIKH